MSPDHDFLLRNSKIVPSGYMTLSFEKPGFDHLIRCHSEVSQLAKAGAKALGEDPHLASLAKELAFYTAHADRCTS